jgi:hypothetical protein
VSFVAQFCAARAGPWHSVGRVRLACGAVMATATVGCVHEFSVVIGMHRHT